MMDGHCCRLHGWALCPPTVTVSLILSFSLLCSFFSLLSLLSLCLSLSRSSLFCLLSYLSSLSLSHSVSHSLFSLLFFSSPSLSHFLTLSLFLLSLTLSSLSLACNALVCQSLSLTPCGVCGVVLSVLLVSGRLCGQSGLATPTPSPRSQHPSYPHLRWDSHQTN